MISPMTVSRETHVWWSLHACGKWPNLFHVKMTKSFGVEIKDSFSYASCNKFRNHEWPFFTCIPFLCYFSRVSSSLAIFIPQFYSEALLQFHSTLSDYLKLQVVTFFPSRITSCSTKVSPWNSMFKIVDNED